METKESWEILEEYILNNDGTQITSFFEKIYPAETARVITHLDEELRQKLLVLLDPQKAADCMRDHMELTVREVIEAKF